MNNVKYIEKPWGSETIIEHNDKYMVKLLFMKKGESCSLQYHREKHETIFVLDGLLNLNYQGISHELTPGQYFVIETGQVHRMTALKDCKYLECSTPENEDVVRLEDNYGREGH
jgi:quercetin dioxygenase-like cupin family protein